MSFSDDVRNELAAIEPKRRCDRLAELSALLHSAGRLHLRGGGDVSVHLDLASPAAARRAFSLLRSFGVSSEIRTYRRRAFDQGTRYQLHVDVKARASEILSEAGVVRRNFAPLARPPKRVVGRACCRAAYLRGALLAAGSVSAPPSPHLELRSTTRDGAEFLASIAAAVDVPMGLVDRRDHAAAYVKGIDRIAGLLATTGANDSALALEERAVVGATKSRANRIANADHANLVRVSRAAHAQLEAVRHLAAERRLAELAPALREIAELRLRHPALSLRELALKCKPPTTKASAHRRLNKLIRLAER
jgi:cell division protein WhiA